MNRYEKTLRHLIHNMHDPNYFLSPAIRKDIEIIKTACKYMTKKITINTKKE